MEKFKLGVISDEISQDLETALKFLKEYNLEWVELRELWGTYVTDIDNDTVKKVQRLLKKYKFRVSVIDTAFLKCMPPGISQDERLVTDQPIGYPYDEQFDLLKRALEKQKHLRLQE